ncbi:MAG: hypothetical protein IPJ41_07035 [Phycisphaerales bacterium]|nr:hypothetical protein [Phycisphaerales bacterium]
MSYVAVVSVWFHSRGMPVMALCGVWQGLQISPSDQAIELKSWAEPTI